MGWGCKCDRNVKIVSECVDLNMCGFKFIKVSKFFKVSYRKTFEKKNLKHDYTYLHHSFFFSFLIPY